MTAILKIWSELPGPGIYPHHGLEAKTLFATDFELWPN